MGIRPPFGGFPSPAERVGNSVFEFSMLSHGVAFPPRPLGAFGAQRRGLFLATPFFAHRLAAHLDTVGVVHQPAENAVTSVGRRSAHAHLATGSWLVKIVERRPPNNEDSRRTFMLATPLWFQFLALALGVLALAC